jgi:hypothetical protein
MVSVRASEPLPDFELHPAVATPAVVIATKTVINHLDVSICSRLPSVVFDRC